MQRAGAQICGPPDTGQTGQVSRLGSGIGWAVFPPPEQNRPLGSRLGAVGVFFFLFTPVGTTRLLVLSIYPVGSTSGPR